MKLLKEKRTRIYLRIVFGSLAASFFANVSMQNRRESEKIHFNSFTLLFSIKYSNKFSAPQSFSSFLFNYFMAISYVRIERFIFSTVNFSISQTVEGIAYRKSPSTRVCFKPHWLSTAGREKFRILSRPCQWQRYHAPTISKNDSAKCRQLDISLKFRWGRSQVTAGQW